MGTGLMVLVGVLVLASAYGVWNKATSGSFKAAKDSAVADTDADTLSAVAIGSPLGESATLVQFSSSFCQPCRATRTILDRVSESVDGVAYVEVDAEENLDLTRELNILRTPTVLVLDSGGVIRHRASGQPRYADVVAALGKVIPGSGSGSAGLAHPAGESAA